MVDIFRVAPDDWQLLRSVRLAALEEAPYAFGSTYEREVDFTEQEWLGRIHRSAWFIARDADERHTGVVAAYSPSDQPEAREIVSMWVEPARRDGKLADALLATATEWARDDGASALTLWVADGNERARRFYVRYGFQPTGNDQPLWGHPGVSATEYLRSLSDTAP